MMCRGFESVRACLLSPLPVGIEYPAASRWESKLTRGRTQHIFGVWGLVSFAGAAA